jgi:hypothetical protein
VSWYAWPKRRPPRRKRCCAPVAGVAADHRRASPGPAASRVGRAGHHHRTHRRDRHPDACPAVRADTRGCDPAGQPARPGRPGDPHGVRTVAVPAGPRRRRRDARSNIDEASAAWSSGEPDPEAESATSSAATAGTGRGWMDAQVRRSGVDTASSPTTRSRSAASPPVGVGSPTVSTDAAAERHTRPISARRLLQVEVARSRRRPAA